MRRSIIDLAVLALVAAGAYAVLAGDRCSTPCGTAKQASIGSACDPAQVVGSCEAPRGKIAGRFDPAMSGVCRFGCATKLKRDPRHYLWT